MARFADFDPPLSEEQEAAGMEVRDLPLCQRLPPVLSALAELADAQEEAASALKESQSVGDLSSHLGRKV